jgi:hypothetical protein
LVPPVVQEVGDVGLCQAGLASQERDAEDATVNPVDQFFAKTLVHLDEFHLRIVRYQLWIEKVLVFRKK